MIKNILLILGIFSIFSFIFSQTLNAQVEKEYVLKNLSPDGSGLISEIKDGTVHFDVRISNYMVATSGFFIDCLNLENDYKGLRLVSDSNPGTLDVINKGSSVISSVEYVVCSTSEATSSNCFSGLSFDGNTFPSYRLNSSSFPNFAAMGFKITGSENVCSGYSITIPETAYLGSGSNIETLPDFRNSVKYIRFIWGVTSFGGKNDGSGIGEQPEIYGLKVKVITDNSVGLEDSPKATNDNIIVSQESDGFYRLSCSSRVELYSLQGRLMMDDSATDLVDLRSFGRGVYLLHVNGEISQKLVY